MRIGAAEARVDFYAILGVSPTATATEIRRAYRALARHSHPDLRGASGADAEVLSERMKQVNIASTILLDPSARARYDHLRGIRRTAPVPREAPVPARPFVPIADSSLSATPAWHAKVRHAKSFWRTRPALGFALAFGVTFAIGLAASSADSPVPVSSSRYKLPGKPIMTTMFVNDLRRSPFTDRRGAGRVPGSWIDRCVRRSTGRTLRNSTSGTSLSSTRGSVHTCRFASPRPRSSFRCR